MGVLLCDRQLQGEPMELCANEDSAMARVATKTLAMNEWQEYDEARPAEYATSCGSMGWKSAPQTSTAVSRKRRLASIARPTKFMKLSMRCRVPIASLHSELASCEDTVLASPTSLQVQFALPGLSSGETRLLFQELASARHELSWLNGTMPFGTVIQPVFGWRSALWSIPTPVGDDAVVFKSAKAFECVSMPLVAQRMWSWKLSSDFPELEAREQVYAVTKHVRVVRQQDRLYGRASRTTLWLECVRRQGESVIIIRKELRGFQDFISSHHSPRERECHGYILHPLLIPMGSQVVTGTAVHSVGSLRTRGQAPEKLIHAMVDAMPQQVLQWEDCFVNGTSR